MRCSRFIVNKAAIVKKIIARLDKDLELYAKAARAAHAEATHEQSKAENKYDTRGLEASYLARGQSRHAAEAAQARQEFEKMEIKNFTSKNGIDVGCYVEVESGGERACYFVGPRAGGTEVTYDKKLVMVITLQSPLGVQLAGKRQGEDLRLEMGGARDLYKIVRVG